MVLIEHLFCLFFSCTTFSLAHTNTSCNSWLLPQTSNNASFVVLSLPSTLWAPLPSLPARFPRQPIRPGWTGHTPLRYTPETHFPGVCYNGPKTQISTGKECVLLICYIEPIRGGEVRVITLCRVGMGRLWEEILSRPWCPPPPHLFFSLSLSLFTCVTLVRWTVSQVCLLLLSGVQTELVFRYSKVSSQGEEGNSCICFSDGCSKVIDGISPGNFQCSLHPCLPPHPPSGQWEWTLWSRRGWMQPESLGGGKHQWCQCWFHKLTAWVIIMVIMCLALVN